MMSTRYGFIVSHEAWYRSAVGVRREIMIGDYPEGGGTTGEFSIRWHSLGGDLSPRLEAFGDSWEVLSDMIDRYGFLRLLHNSGEDATPEQVVNLLLALEFEDLTQRENPMMKAEEEEALPGPREDGRDRLAWLVKNLELARHALKADRPVAVIDSLMDQEKT